MPEIRLIPGPGESLQVALLEPTGIAFHLSEAPDSERSSFQLWTDLRSLTAWLAPKEREDEVAAAPAAIWHAETATFLSPTELRIATVPLHIGL